MRDTIRHMASGSATEEDRATSRAGETVRPLYIAVAGLVICALLLVGPLAGFVSASSGWLDYPYPRPGSEGLILYESLLLKRGGDIYAPITPERFISGPYPPIYYWLAAATLPDKLPDFAGPLPPVSEFRGGRIISLLSALLAAALVPLIVIVEGGYMRRGQTALVGALAGLLGGALFLTLPQTIVWATRFRGDMLMIAFTAAGLLCVAAATRQQSPLAVTPAHEEAEQTAHRLAWPLLALAAVFFALAFFTKQTALAGPVASAAYLLLRDRRAGLRWCLLMGAAVGLPFLLLDLATGNWFYLKMVSYHSLPLRWVTLTRLLQFAFLEDEWPLILLALGYAASRLFAWARGFRSDGGRQLPSLVALFTVSAFAFLPTGAVVGADHNHLLMPGLAVALASGAALAYVLARPASGKRSLPTLGSATAALLLIAAYAAVTSAPSSWYAPDLTVPTAQVQEQYRQIVQNVKQNPAALFFSDDPGIVALAGKETPYDDPFTMTALAQAGRWDEGAYRTSLRQGRFGLLVLSCDVNAPQFCRADTFTSGVLEAVRAGYTVLFRDVMYTYAPKQR